MGSISSERRLQYFKRKTEILLPSGLCVKIKSIELYAESIGIVIPNRTQKELVVIVGEELEKVLSGQMIGKKINNEGRFSEQIFLKIDSLSFSSYAIFELAQEEYSYFIRPIYIT